MLYTLNFMDAKNDAMHITLLKDIYGPLLTGRQSEMLSLFYDFDNSLSEIAEQYGVSRQAVRDVIERAKAQLEDAETRLGFANKIKCTLKVADQLRLVSGASALAEELDLIWEKENGIVLRIE